MELRARLSFPHGEHVDVPLRPGSYGIGSASGNQVVLAASGVQAQHARLDVDSRGLTLTVLASGASTHVNARPVRERAILRPGDSLSIDTVQIMLKPDRDEAIRTQVPPAEKLTPEAETRLRNVPPRVVLRGVSGGYFGKIIAVRARLVIGRGSDCDLVLDEPEMSRRHAMIENSGDGIYLRDLGSANGTFVNGVQVKDAVLHPGDQLAFDRNRFLIEAPGLPLREPTPPPTDANAPMITQTMRAVDVPVPAPVAKPKPTAPATPPAAATPEPAGSRNEIWWLIGAAALIGGGIALLLLVKF